MVNEIILDRQTHILISDTIMGTSVGLYPSNDIYPSDSEDILYPTDATFIESNIVEGSMTLDEVIADGDIDLGKLYSTKFECDLYNVENTLQGKFIQVYQTSDEYSYNIPIFLGYIDSCTSNRLGTDWHLIAYDLAYYYGGINIADKWNTYMSTTSVITTTYGDFPIVTRTPSASVKIDWCAFLKMILDDLNIVHSFTFNLSLEISCIADVGTNPFVDILVNKTVQKMTLSDLISSICQLAMVIPHFDKDGVFRVIDLDTSASALENALDLTDNYEKENLNITQLIHPPFDNIEYKYTHYKPSSFSTTSLTLNSNTNKYSITNNILLLTAGCLEGGGTVSPSSISTPNNYQYDNTSLITSICTYLQSLEYYVGSMSLIVSDVSNILGDLVKVDIDDLDGNYKETLYFPVLKSTYTGTQLINQTVEASGTVPSVADTQQVDYSNENTQTQVENMQTQVTAVETALNNITTSIDYETTQSIATNTNTSIVEKTIGAGTYLITGFISFPSNTNSDTGIRQMRIAYSIDLSTAISYDANDIRTAISGSRVLTKCVTIHTFSSSTTLELVGYHTAGTTLNNVIGQLNTLRIS